MDERRLKSYFRWQARTIIRHGVPERDGFLAYFAEHEPRDEEILGLLVVSTTMGSSNVLRDAFPTPLEALAALSLASRSEICRDFRKQLKTCFEHRSATSRPATERQRPREKPHLLKLSEASVS